MQRTVLHLDLDSFFVSVECLKDSRLLGKPVIVGGSSDRGVVAACSYEARKFGIHSAMPARMAKQLCPNAIFIRGDYASYSDYSKQVTDLVVGKAPVVEKASIDEFYVDLTGMDRFVADSYTWSLQLKQSIKKEIGLNVTVGVSANKTVSKVAVGQAKPNGQIFVPYGTESAFLRHLPVGKLPMVGPKTTKLLQSMRISTIGDLARIPQKVLVRVFGKNGFWMWQHANGIDSSDIVPYAEQKSISKESTFESDTTDMAFLRQQIIGMVSELAFDLRNMKHITGCISVKIRYADFDTNMRQMAIPYTASDHVLRQFALDLFAKLYERRVQVRLIGVKYSKLAMGGTQLSLFDKSSTVNPLYQAMDKIRNKYGLGAVMPATVLKLRK